MKRWEKFFEMFTKFPETFINYFETNCLLAELYFSTCVENFENFSETITNFKICIQIVYNWHFAICIQIKVCIVCIPNYTNLYTQPCKTGLCIHSIHNLLLNLYTTIQIVYTCVYK